jgi:POT family proton-dependent oligopeptide transporter
VSALKTRLAAIPSGAGALFFIQTFATLGFAVLYSTLVLYATKHLGMSAKQATALMGVFGAFNYGLHLFGGYLGGRFLSNRNLFVGGMVSQMLGCACMSVGTSSLFYWGLARCFGQRTQRHLHQHDADDASPGGSRRWRLPWNYAGMNIGFFIGFTAAATIKRPRTNSSLFIFAVGNFSAIVLAVLT